MANHSVPVQTPPTQDTSHGRKLHTSLHNTVRMRHCSFRWPLIGSKNTSVYQTKNTTDCDIINRNERDTCKKGRTQTKEQSVTQEPKNWNTTKLEHNSANITERDKKEKNVAKNSARHNYISKHLLFQGDYIRKSLDYLLAFFSLK